MTTRRFASALLLTALASCGITGRYMPHDIKGDTPLAVENTWGDDICTLLVAPPSKDETKYNLLYSTMSGVKPLKAGENATFKVRPGPYSVYAESCQRGFEGGQKITVSGPTYVSIGDRGKVPDGYAAISLTSGPLTSCIITGQMNDGRPCCSGMHHFDPDFQQNVCEE
jgi:hypothetical protein